jgi:hypothetical protein
VRRIMNLDWSWRGPAVEYISLYRSLLASNFNDDG